MWLLREVVLCLPLNSSCMKMIFPVNAFEASWRDKFFVLTGARGTCWCGKFARMFCACVVLLYFHCLGCLLEY